MLQITFYNLSKKVNSTKQPDVTGETVDCVLKTASSITAPVVEIKRDSIPAWNYAYIPDMGRYYFVTGTAYNRGVWEISLSVDVLASFKNDIKETDMYVLRSSASYDGRLVDNLYPALDDHTTAHVLIKNWSAYQGNGSTTGGCIIINLANGDSNTGVTTYAFTVPGFANLVDQLMIDADCQIAGYDAVTQAVKVSAYDPIRYINTVYWFPWLYTNYIYPSTVPKTQLKLGNFLLTNIQAYPVWSDNSGLKKTITISASDFPKHPQAASRGSFCNLDPFSNYVLNLGPFGGITLDTAVLAEASSITIEIYQDVITGLARCEIYTDKGALVANLSTQWGVPLKLFQSGAAGIGQFVSGIGKNIGAALSQQWELVDVSSVASGVGSMVKGALTSTGSNGAIMEHIMPWYLDATFYKIADEDNANNGRPLCKVRKPKNIAGYIKAEKGVVKAAGATRPELDSISAYMEGGFYYE